MISRRWSPLLAVVLSAAVLLTAPAAHADRSVTKDAVADVLSVTLADADGDGDEEETKAPAPDETTVDITRTVVQHRVDRLRVSVSYRDLQLGRDAFHFTMVRVVTPRGGYRVEVENLSRPKGAARLQKGRRTVECRGLRWSVDEGTDKVAVSMPTACLGTPRWVQVGVGAVSADAAVMAAESDEMQIFADDGNRAGRLSEKSIARGPKVFVG